ncbi:glycosyl transferase [Allorhizobium sp. BGMRC 0089]|uniref:O-linked N-acetylglucosamine transferase, SPINDLY family protein n=1 Tax=Allorhizobium sonneratiae TaxID=2934936 RepID=UPI00203385C9|nr:glycosyl transferase [Allorhizobium sonneratiae]
MGNGAGNVTVADVFDLARKQALPVGQVFEIAEAWNRGGHVAQAAELYKTWIAFNQGNPLLHLVYFNYAVTLRRLEDVSGSIHALRACIALKPDFAQAHINLGRAYEDGGQLGQAVLQWQEFTKATADITPDRFSFRLMALKHIGRVMENAEQYEEAERFLAEVLELQPEAADAGLHLTGLRQRQCKWPVIMPSERVSARQLLDSMSTLTLSCYADDPLFLMAKAYRHQKKNLGYPEPADLMAPTVRAKTGTGERLKIGYVSSDLRDHAVGFALSELLELHDKTSVEIYAYYIGEPRQGDPTQERMKKVIDVWRDIAAMEDLDAARLIIADGIDILIDVNGYTKHARTKLFAYRPAPVIVNFCGYPGTMATPYHQYMIADPVIVPPGSEIYYTEKVLHIPCNQPVDRKRLVAERPTRAEAGLPEDAFVFACFNGMQKINEACFKRWIAILGAVPNSLLWLLSGPDAANQRLRDLAAAAGLDPARIVFAGKAPNPQHLARIALADLFLDTFPYGAHSTAADAITMGLPVLTMPGKSFATRFCASIVTAAGVAELIVESPEAYVEKAVALANDRQALKAIRQKIADQRETCALRDMPGLAKRLEDLFWQMQGEAERGEIPVPDLRNLDLYYDVGAKILLDSGDFETDDAYRRRFRNRLDELNRMEPIYPDSRLWPSV